MNESWPGYEEKNHPGRGNKTCKGPGVEGSRMPFGMGEQPVEGAAVGGVVSEEGRCAAAAWLADVAGS